MTAEKNEEKKTKKRKKAKKGRNVPLGIEENHLEGSPRNGVILVGRRVPGGSSQSAARPFDRVWPGPITFVRGECE